VKVHAVYLFVVLTQSFSRHTEGKAIDMSIAWIGDLVIAKADGTNMTVKSAPRSGDNASLQLPA
jgi:hypothetical protein